MSHNLLLLHLFIFLSLSITSSLSSPSPADSHPYLWPLPVEFSSGNDTLSVDPAVTLIVAGNGGGSPIVRAAFERYMGIIFKHVSSRASLLAKIRFLRMVEYDYDITSLKIIVHSDSEELQLGVDESYTLVLSKKNDQSIVGAATIEANTVYGALRGQRCASMTLFFSFFRLQFHHMEREYEQSILLEIPTFPNLWKGAYSRWEHYTVEYASEIVRFAKMRGVLIISLELFQSLLCFCKWDRKGWHHVAGKFLGTLFIIVAFNTNRDGYCFGSRSFLIIGFEIFHSFSGLLYVFLARFVCMRLLFSCELL